jgi:hypothetical protein
MIAGVNKLKSVFTAPQGGTSGGVGDRGRPSPRSADTVGRTQARLRRDDNLELIPARPLAAMARPRSVSPPGSRVPIVVHSWLEDLPPEAFAQRLTASVKEALITEADRRERTLHFSTAAMPLAVARKARLLEARSAVEVSFRQVRHPLPMGPEQMVQAYQGGTCFTLCADLMEHVQKRFGLRSYALIKEGSPQAMALWPSFTHKDAQVWVEDILEHVEHTGHVDLVLPYSDGAGPRVLVLPTGQVLGAEPQDLPLAHKLRQDGPGRLLAEPHNMAYRALWGRTRLHILTPGEDCVFGIDFILSTMFVNSKAHRAVTAATPPHPAGKNKVERSFCFARLPRRAEAATTPGGAEAWQKCLIYLTAMRRTFRLSADCIYDLAFLIDRRHSYLQDIVHPMARALKDSVAERELALHRYAEVEELLAGRHHPEATVALHEARARLREARAAIVGCDGGQARDLYAEAANRTDDAAGLLRQMTAAGTQG